MDIAVETDTTDTETDDSDESESRGALGFAAEEAAENYNKPSLVQKAPKWLVFYAGVIVGILFFVMAELAVMAAT